MRDRLHAWKDRLTAFFQSDTGQRVTKVVKTTFTLGIVVYLGWELTRIGWGNIWANLPTNPLFYLLFVAVYLQLPLFEVLIYRITWSFNAWASIPAFIKKRVYNKDVLGYAGEVYFFAWANDALSLSKRRIAETIRDNNIISSAASTFIAVVLLVFFLSAGSFSLTEWIGRTQLYYVGGGMAAVLLLIPVAIRFRKYLFSMTLRVTALIFAIQCGRLLLLQVIQIGQWNVAMPEVSLEVWFTYAAVTVVISRIPFLPNHDLVFMAAGIQMGEQMAISTAGIAGMLGVLAALGKVSNFVVLAGIMVWNRTYGTGEHLDVDDGLDGEADAPASGDDDPGRSGDAGSDEDARSASQPAPSSSPESSS